MCDKEKQCSDSSQKNQKIALSLSKMICSFDPLPYLPKKVNLAAQLAISRCIAQLPRQLAAFHFLPCAVPASSATLCRAQSAQEKLGRRGLRNEQRLFKPRREKRQKNALGIG